MKNKFYPNITFVFLTFIFMLPIVTLIGNIAGQVRSMDNKELSSQTEEETNSSVEEINTSMEEGDSSAEEKFSFAALQEDITEFTDNLFLRKKLISLNMGFTSLLTGGAYFESTQVLPGKDGWLFYKSKDDGQSIYDYMGINHFTEDELRETAENLAKTQDYFVKERGVSFYALAVPNKELVYPEKMPDTVTRINPTSRGAQLADYLETDTNLPFLYVKSALMDAKKECQIYYTTDTHWNQIGAYVALQAFFQEFYGNSASVDSVSFVVTQQNVAGDLAILAGIEDRYSVDTVYTLAGNTVDPVQYHDESLLIIGDSFAEFLYWVAKPYYRDVHWVHEKNFSPEMLKEYEADTVIWECVERYLDVFQKRKLWEGPDET